MGEYLASSPSIRQEFTDEHGRLVKTRALRNARASRVAPSSSIDALTVFVARSRSGGIAIRRSSLADIIVFGSLRIEYDLKR